jgi:hypothetical protein
MFGGGQFGGVSSSAPANDQIDAPHAVGEKHPEGDEPSFEEVVVPGPFSEPTTIVRESPLATSYSVEGKSTIPSDGEAHQVSVAVLPFEAKVMHVAVPRIEPLVYLQVCHYCFL